MPLGRREKTNFGSTCEHKNKDDVDRFEISSFHIDIHSEEKKLAGIHSEEKRLADIHSEEKRLAESSSTPSGKAKTFIFSSPPFIIQSSSNSLHYNQ